MRLPGHSLWVRFPMAVFVAFCASVATFLLGFFVTWLVYQQISAPSSMQTSSAGPRWLFIVMVSLTGFAGVYSGGLCLLPRHRGVGALLLLVLGLYFDFELFGTAHGQFAIPLNFYPLAFGGTVAVLAIWFRFRLTKTVHTNPDSESGSVTSSR